MPLVEQLRSKKKVLTVEELADILGIAIRTKRRRMQLSRRENRKGCDRGYAPVASSCDQPTAWMHAPSQPLMRSLLSRFQTPTAPRGNSRFFGVRCSSGCPAEWIT